jgi:hypothetical protein
MSIDVRPTVEVIENMSNLLDGAAMRLRQIAKYIERDQDLERASDAASVIQNAMMNMRLDLLIIRPQRELLREIVRLKLEQEK